MFQGKDKLNRYTCDKCNQSVITIDRENGVTPFCIACRATPGCQGLANSSMYRGVIGTPTYEWRFTTPEEYKALPPSAKDHADNGGLFIHPILIADTEKPLFPRNIVFGPDPSTLGAALGMSSPRGVLLEQLIDKWVNDDVSLQQIIINLNERGDLTDNEWTATIFGLGHFCARIGR